MKLAIACDHRGLLLKNALIEHLRAEGHVLIDFGTYTPESTDYPIYGERVGRAVAEGECELGIAICGTGFGISLGAGAVPGIRAVCCSDIYTAAYSRQHNNANVLAIGRDVVGEKLAFMIADTFLSSTFEGGRHLRRLNMVERLRRTAAVTGKKIVVHVNDREFMLYNQRSVQWTHPYEYPPRPGDTLKSAGCGVFSLCEAIEFMSGQRIAPEEMADFSCRVGGRGDDGTDRPMLLKGVVESGLAGQYGFRYDMDGLLNDHEKLWECLTNGGCALCNLRVGHIVTLLGWRVSEEGERQVLAMDCHSESADERVRESVREVVPESLITYPVTNEAGVMTGSAQAYGLFWVPLELPKNFNLLHHL